MPKTKHFLSTTDAAEIAEVSKRTIIRWAEDGLLIPDRILPSGYLQFTRETVDEFLESLKPAAR